MQGAHTATALSLSNFVASSEYDPKVALLNTGFRGNGISIYQTNTVDGGFTIGRGVSITDWGNYGILLSGTNTFFGLSDYDFTQNVDAEAGGDGSNGDSSGNDHGPFRTSMAANSDLYLGAGNIFSNTGWNLDAHQACIRTNGGVSTNRINIERLVAEGGWAPISLYDTAASGETLPMNILMDKFITLGNALTQYNIRVAFGATSLRNGVVVMPNVPTENSTGFRGLVRLEDAGDDAQNLAEPISITGMTLVNLLDVTNDPTEDTSPWIPQDATFTNLTLGEHTTYAPNATTTVNAAVARDTVEQFDTNYKGRLLTGGSLDTAYATPDGLAALYSPDTVVFAVGTDVPIDDIVGDVRIGTLTAGAMHTGTPHPTPA